MSAHAEPTGSGDSKVDLAAELLLLVPAPDVPAAIARELTRELPARLDGRRWRVAVDDEELLAEDFGGLVEAARAARERTGAELAVCLTDVPLRTGRSRAALAHTRARRPTAVHPHPTTAGGRARPRVARFPLRR
jgi:hypothetical protein